MRESLGGEELYFSSCSLFPFFRFSVWLRPSPKYLTMSSCILSEIFRSMGKTSASVRRVKT